MLHFLFEECQQEYVYNQQDNLTFVFSKKKIAKITEDD
jgi:hypothetical protein